MLIALLRVKFMKGNLVYIVNRIMEVRPQLETHDVGVAVVKLEKLARTLKKRFEMGFVNDQHTENTEQFFKKAQMLAHELGGQFVYSDQGVFYLKVDALKERIL